MKNCIVIGDPVEHSKSPILHTFAYELLGLQGGYFFGRYRTDLTKDGEVERLNSYIKENNVVGISVTTPNKNAIMQICDRLTEEARQIDSVNSVVINGGEIVGHNNDWLGVVGALGRHVDVVGKKVAVLGAGPTASSAVYGLAKKGALVTIFNRTLDKARMVAEKFGTLFSPLSDLDVSEFDVIVNTTTVGFNKLDESPIDTEKVCERHVVLDAVYNPIKTKLLAESEKKGAKIIYGTDMLASLIVDQVVLYTGRVLNKEQTDAFFEYNSSLAG